ncbi:MAG: hypothetical protein QOF37_2009 [Thermoleophilaceae bacterium]|jgi:hypothetical protein|nr:hypothetical protein [Thermoleophilaceae bacterium]
MIVAPRLLMPLGALVITLLVAALGLGFEDVRPVTAAAEQTVQPATRADYLRAASAATRRSSAWWDKRRHWYLEQLGGPGKYPLATLWGVVHLFEAKNALAIAAPTPARKAAVRAFARGAERYWNPNLRPVPGYGPYPDSRGRRDRTWYDDNGWWGIAFHDAYRATGDARYLASAKRALMFLDSGWDRRKGGIWWETTHSFKAGESLAGGTLLAALLYQETHSPKYLAIARKYVNWADRDFRGEDGLYDRHEHDDTPMPYVQGPMFNAFAVLCGSTHNLGYCREAEELADRAANRFPKLTMGPQYDAMYIRALLELYRIDHNARWYGIAKAEVDRAMTNAPVPNGLYLRNWDGGPMSAIGGSKPNALQTHAATTSVIAWMAAAQPPR